MKMSMTVFVVNPFGRLQFNGLYQLGQRFRRIYQSVWPSDQGAGYGRCKEQE